MTFKRNLPSRRYTFTSPVGVLQHLRILRELFPTDYPAMTAIPPWYVCYRGMA